jgi:uroporphyrinogen-III synthase
MLEHYNGLHSHPSSASPPKLPLLFLVGEQRRDIIPKTLMDDHLPEDQRIQVDELVVYETAEMESFPSDFEGAIVEAKDAAGEGVVWVVVFSPTGCEAMLKGLGWLDEEKKYKGRSGRDGVFVATIGPTTRDYLLTTFGFEPDVCAEKPSPEGVRDGIEKFIRERGVG